VNAPKRWSDVGGGATRDEKALLEAGTSETMPTDLRERLWASIALAAAASSAAATVTTEAASRGALGATPVASTTKGLTLLSSSLAKGVVAVAMLGGIGSGAALLHTKPATKPAPPSPSQTARPLPSASAPATTARTTSESESNSSLGDGEREVAPATSAVVSARREKLRSAASVELPVSRLREESLAVLAIRKSLLAGRASEALRLLQGAQRDFPGGVLTEEREALTVRALFAAGQKAAAQQRGAAFLKSFPRSAHAAEVRRLLDD